VAAYLEKFYLSQHLDFQQVYGRLNSQLFSTTQVDVLSSEADYDVIENFSPPPPMPDTEPIFTMVEELPEFWGGQQELINFLSKTIVYPTDAREKDIGGRVVVQFVIDREGKVRQPEIKRSVYESLDREALRVISAMPPWKPGKQQGKTVNTYFVLPIIFRID
jgi:protein TonB